MLTIEPGGSVHRAIELLACIQFLIVGRLPSGAAPGLGDDPHCASRKRARVAIERAWEFQVAGALIIGLSGLMAYLVART